MKARECGLRHRAPESALFNRSLLLVVAFLPWPPRWDRVRGAVDSARSPELNRAEREGHAAGYYEGLIGGNSWRRRLARRSAHSGSRASRPAGSASGKPTSFTT